jgi:flagellin-like protein
MKEKRGLSPVIATVLLVGLVVVSGLIIFTWFRGLTQEAITKFDQNIQIVCKDISFDARYSATDGKLAISNVGNIPIFGFKVKISDSSGFQTTDITEYANWPDGGLNQGGATSVDLGSVSGDITLIPVLAGVSQKGAQASFTCDEKLYGQQVLV